VIPHRRSVAALVLIALGLLAIGRGCGSDGASQADAMPAGASGANSGSGGTGGFAAAPSSTGGAASSSDSGNAGAGGGGNAASAGQAGKGGATGNAGSGGKGGSGAGTGGGTLDKNGCVVSPRPVGVPEDWQANTDWSCDCPIYYPGETGTPAKPITWLPCEPPFPASLACKRMEHFWRKGNGAIGVLPRFALDADGKALLQIGRLRDDANPSLFQHLVGEADGKVRVVYTTANNPGVSCGVYGESISATHYAFSIADDSLTGTGDETGDGLLAGMLDEPSPSLLRHLDFNKGSLYSNWAVTTKLLARNRGPVTGLDWDLNNPFPLYTPADDPSGEPCHGMSTAKESFFFEVGELTQHGIWCWDEQHGSHALLRHAESVPHAAANFATDGNDMVWTDLQDPLPDTSTFATLSVMTAPFSTDATVVAKTAHRLRADLYGVHGDPFVVGCGYAARHFSPGEPLNNALYVVRLSDGVAWLFPGTLPASALSWGRTLGITCDELFVTVTASNNFTIARIRLDSLGPGLAPD
jgi:hypothetical protein